MKKNLSTAASLLLILSLLSGCMDGAAVETPTETPEPTPTVSGEASLAPQPTPGAADEMHTLDPSQEPPLEQEDADIPVPEFLNEELQNLYRRANNIYHNLFIDTGESDYFYTFKPGTFPDEPIESFEDGTYTYIYSQGRYRNWADFNALVHAVFTDRLFQELNALEDGDMIYRERDGQMCYVNLLRPNPSTRNSRFPDTFELIEETEDRIRFYVVGYYSYRCPLEGETDEERGARLLAGYEYTEKFEIVLLNTENGWRFDSFYDTSVDASEYLGSLGQQEEKKDLKHDDELPFNTLQNPPLGEEDLAVPVPEFLNEEQQLLYRRASNVYRNLFMGETLSVEYADAFEPGTFSQIENKTVEIGHRTYWVSQGLYKNWNDFDALVHSVFTDRFFQEKNLLSDGSKFFLENNEELCFLNFIYVSWDCRNDNFPDTFELASETQDKIVFYVVGYYNNFEQIEGETDEEREIRTASYELTRKYPIIMVNTDLGWRFDSFYDTTGDSGPFENLSGQ